MRISQSLLYVNDNFEPLNFVNLFFDQCQICKAEEAEAECYKCHTVEDGATLLVCDECNRGAHLHCIGLKEEPDTDEWVCPVCSPDFAKKNAAKSVMVNVGGGRPKLGNVDICYVCQKSKVMTESLHLNYYFNFRWQTSLLRFV